MEDANPYKAPASLEAETPPTASRLPLRLLAGWTAVFLLNMPLPLLFGWIVTEKGGRAGMFAAAAILLVLGGWLCASQRKLGVSLVVGGVPMAISQLFPLLQIMAGIVALSVGEFFHQVENKNDAMGEVVSEPGGFLITMITGALLMAAALTLGLLIRALLPSRWRERALRQPEALAR